MIRAGVRVLLALVALACLGAPSCEKMSQEKRDCYKRTVRDWNECRSLCDESEHNFNRAGCLEGCDNAGTSDKKECDRKE